MPARKGFGRGRQKGLFDDSLKGPNVESRKTKPRDMESAGDISVGGPGAFSGAPPDMASELGLTRAGTRPPTDPKTGLPQGLSVGALTRLIQGVLSENFPPVWVEGELSNFRRYASGHCYFTLKDAEAQLSCVMWRSHAAQLRFSPADGAKVLARGRVEVYLSRGQYQFVTDRLEPTGVGALAAALEELKSRLAAEGLFAPERKKRPPLFPQRIGLVTSAAGAAVRDILEITGRRWPAAEIVLAPVRVQGEGAAAEISAAIAAFNRLRCADVLIVGRGGGSLEDLWAFNEEPTVRAIAQSEIPIVSAVGHETDVTLADLAADVRAATPSHAAELITPDRADWAQQWRALGSALAKAPLKRLESAREKLEQASRSAAFRRPLDRLEYLREKLDDLQDELRPDAVRLVERLRERLGGMAAQLEGLSPLNVLARGYSVTRLAAGKVVRTVADAQPGAKLETRVADGIVRSTVED